MMCLSLIHIFGHGYDVHRLVKGRKLILGGVHIPWEMGLLGHSDADVLAHAVIDSLLGAAALGLSLIHIYCGFSGLFAFIHCNCHYKDHEAKADESLLSAN